MRSFYMLTVTALLLMSLGLLAFATTFSGLVIPPTRAHAVSDVDERASDTISGFVRCDGPVATTQSSLLAP
jgi:hypothetical protein